MIVLASVLLAALLATNYLWLRELRKFRSDAWNREQNLLNRIQKPDVFQPAAAVDEEMPTEPQGPQDEWDLVGTVSTSEPDGG